MLLRKKQCTQCKKWKGKPFFSKQKNGLRASCKICCAVQRKLYGEQNKEKLAAYKKNWNAQNKEHTASYYINNKEKFNRPLSAEQKEKRSLYSKQYNLENAASVKQARKNWQQRNNIKVREYAANRRSRLKNQWVENVDYLTVFERDNWTCGLCGGVVDSTVKYPDPQAVQLDHVIPIAAGGQHSYKNTQCAHAVCNQKKSRTYGRGKVNE